MFGNLIRLFKNRFFLAGLGFVLWLLLLDEYHWLGQAKVRREWRHLQEEQSFYDSSIQEMTREKAALESDTLLLERLAREKYRMIKPGESVFWVLDSVTKTP
ncbi:MAG: FtsB family cell division protein [Bacteroidota bacterium]